MNVSRHNVIAGALMTRLTYSARSISSRPSGGVKIARVVLLMAKVAAAAACLGVSWVRSQLSHPLLHLSVAGDGPSQGAAWHPGIRYPWGSEPASEHVATLQAPRNKIAKTRVSSLKARWLIAAVVRKNLDGLAHLGLTKRTIPNYRRSVRVRLLWRRGRPDQWPPAP